MSKFSFNNNLSFNLNEQQLANKFENALNGKSVVTTCPKCKAQMTVTVSSSTNTAVCPNCHSVIPCSFSFR